MGEAVYEIYLRPGSGKACLLCKKPVEVGGQAFLLKMDLNAFGIVKIPQSKEIHFQCGVDLATAIRKKKSVDGAYKLKVKRASGEKECLLCNEKIPGKLDSWNLDIAVVVLGIELPKREEIHFDCGDRFSGEVEGLAKDV